MSTYFDQHDSFTDLTFTYVDSKLTCWKPFYTAHVLFAYLIVISGLLAMLTRVWMTWLHLWMGRLYIIFMIWGTATSLLIHNEGLPIGVLWSFLWCLLSLSISYILIGLHQRHRGYFKQFFPKEESFKSKWQLIFWRLFSFKGIHGCLMFVSWINLAGRLFVTSPTKDFECFTYPIYKPVQSLKDVPGYSYTGGNYTPLPQLDPNYNKMPWANIENGWSAAMSLGMYALAFVVGLIFLLITQRNFGKKVNDVEDTRPCNQESQK